MSSNYPGARPHGAPQDTEMDVAWQELMAIPELQVTLTYGFPRLCLFPPKQANVIAISQAALSWTCGLFLH